MSWTKATLVKLELCGCGFPTLHEDIPIGTEYKVDLEDVGPGTLICGGCRKRRKVHLIKTANRLPPLSGHGYLPMELFAIEEGSTKPIQRD